MSSVSCHLPAAPPRRRGSAQDLDYVRGYAEGSPAQAGIGPITLVALGLWLVNDHVLKGVCPGPFTGKASDVAGLVAFPIVLLATFPERFVERLGIVRAAWLGIVAAPGMVG